MVVVGDTPLCWLICLLFQKLCAVSKPLPRSEGQTEGNEGKGTFGRGPRGSHLNSLLEKSSCLQTWDLSTSLLISPCPPLQPHWPQHGS